MNICKRIMNLKLLFMFLILWPMVSMSETFISLKDVKTKFNGKTFVSRFIFDQSIEGMIHNVDFINETVQLDFSGVQIKEGRKVKKIKKNKVKSLYIYQAAKDTLRARIIYNGLKTKELKNSVEVIPEGQTLIVKIYDPSVGVMPTVKPISKAIVKPRSLEVLPPKKIVIDDTRVIKKERVVSSAKTNKSKASAEEQIPLFKKSIQKKKQAESSSLTRMFLSLFVILSLTLGGFFGVRHWLNKKGVKQSNNKIQVLTQHYLGPKKSLAIVRVAGESILIGVTDQNINMIKSLALMSEEIEEIESQNFGETLRKENVQGDLDSSSSSQHVPDHLNQDDLDDEFTIGGIRDFVSNRLKGMKEL